MLPRLRCIQMREHCIFALRDVIQKHRLDTESVSAMLLHMKGCFAERLMMVNLCLEQ
jgi:hypothetical protein